MSQTTSFASSTNNGKHISIGTDGFGKVVVQTKEGTTKHKYFFNKFDPAFAAYNNLLTLHNLKKY